MVSSRWAIIVLFSISYTAGVRFGPRPHIGGVFLQQTTLRPHSTLRACAEDAEDTEAIKYKALILGSSSAFSLRIRMIVFGKSSSRMERNLPANIPHPIPGSITVAGAKGLETAFA